VIAIGGKVLASALALWVVGASAQQSTEDIPGLTIDTKVTPKRSFIFYTYGYDLEVDLSFAGPLPDFSSFFLQCELDRGDDSSRGAVWLKIVRGEFKPDAKGGQSTVRGGIPIPGGGPLDVKCRVRKSPT
jgi:hypothetical protein